MSTFLLLGFLAGSSPDDDAVAALALARAARDRTPIVSVEPVRTGYPVRGNWWTGCPNWTHLTTGIHAGSFPVEWLKTLTNAEVQSLHSDQHENKVRWEYVPKARASLEPVTGQNAGKKLVSGSGSSLNPSSRSPAPYTPRTLYAPAYCPPGVSH
jgi:hypothetical protein